VTTAARIRRVVTEIVLARVLGLPVESENVVFVVDETEALELEASVGGILLAIGFISAIVFVFIVAFFFTIAFLLVVIILAPETLLALLFLLVLVLLIFIRVPRLLRCQTLQTRSVGVTLKLDNSRGRLAVFLAVLVNLAAGDFDTHSLRISVLLFQASDFRVFAAATSGIQSGNGERSHFGRVPVFVVIVYRSFKAADYKSKLEQPQKILPKKKVKRTAFRRPAVGTFKVRSTAQNVANVD
jgi:hypothetical protein